MLSTYLNDNKNVPYPFFGGEALPFPLSCISGISLCILTENSDMCKTPVYVSNITINATSIKVVICSGADILGTAEAVLTGSYGSGHFICTKNGLTASGYLTIGTIPDTAVGEYTGTFYIDPSCVTYITPDVYGKHTELTVNDMEYSIGKLLSISCTGSLYITTKGRIGVSSGLSMSDMVDTGSVTNYSMVTSINRQYPSAKNDTLYIITDSTDEEGAIKYTATYKETSPVIVVDITGTGEFPNCYGELDESEVTRGS